jgi:putative MATE family efflux protein
MKLRTLFSDKRFFKALFGIAIPIMLQNLISSLVTMINTVMIGNLGTANIAAVGLGNQVFFLLNMIIFGITSGGAVFTAQFWGQRDIAGIRKTTGWCLALSSLVSALFAGACLAFPQVVIGLYTNDAEVIRVGAIYLRALAPSFLFFGVSMVFTMILRSIERVKLTMTATCVSLGLGILLNWGLIFGIGPLPALGVAGAGIATSLARVVEMGIIVVGCYARRYSIAGSPRDLFRLDAPFIGRYLRVAAPVILNELFWSLGITMQNVIFARTNTDAFAAFNILNVVSNLTWVIFIGLGNGCGVLIGKKIGEGQNDLAREYAARITRFAPLAALAISAFLLPLSRLLPWFFSVEPGVFTIINALFIVLALSYPFRAFNLAMIIGVCRAGGDTVFSVIYDLAIMWLVSLPLAALASFVFHAPVWLIFVCIEMENPLKMCLGAWRLHTGKWLHDVTA